MVCASTHELFLSARSNISLIVDRAHASCKRDVIYWPLTGTVINLFIAHVRNRVRLRVRARVREYAYARAMSWFVTHGCHD